MFYFLKFKKAKDFKRKNQQIDEIQQSFYLKSFEEWKSWALEVGWVLNWNLWKTIWVRKNFKIPLEYSQNKSGNNQNNQNNECVFNTQNELFSFLWENFRKNKWKKGDFDFFLAFFSSSLDDEMRKVWLRNVFLWMQRDDEDSQVEKAIDILISNDCVFNCFKEEDLFAILSFFNRGQAKKLIIFAVEKSFSAGFFEKVLDLFKGIVLEEDGWVNCFSDHRQAESDPSKRAGFPLINKTHSPYARTNERAVFSNKLFPLCYAFRCYQMYGSASCLNILKVFVKKFKPVYCLDNKEKEKLFYRNFISSLVKDSYKTTRFGDFSLSYVVLCFFCNNDISRRTQGMIDFDVEYEVEKGFLRRLWRDEIDFHFGKKNDLPERMVTPSGEYWFDPFIKRDNKQNKEKMVANSLNQNQDSSQDSSQNLNSVNGKLFQVNTIKSFVLTKKSATAKEVEKGFNKEKMFVFNNFIFQFSEKAEVFDYQKKIMKMMESEREDVVRMFLNFLVFNYDEIKAKKVFIYYLRKFSKQNNYDFFIKAVEKYSSITGRIVFFDRLGKEKNTNLWFKNMRGFIDLSNRSSNEICKESVVFKEVEKINLIDGLFSNNNGGSVSSRTNKTERF